MSELIEDLGLILPSPTAKTKYRMGIYLCDTCGVPAKQYIKTVEKVGRALCDTCRNKLKASPIKPLLQEDYKMRIIEDLGRIPDGKGNNNHEAIFECTKCKEHIQRKVASSSLKEQEYCLSCSNSFNNVKHGDHKARLYKIREGMLRRCYNENYSHYSYYGGKGVTVCDEWKDSYEVFKAWALENGYNDTLTIDRIDSNGDYEPSNCRWATRTTQQRNTTDIRKDNTSGYRGVSLTANKKAYRARLKVNNKEVPIGVFETALEAAKALHAYVIVNNLNHNITPVLSEEEISALKASLKDTL